MKLGIVVVYIVSEENESLLDLHLRQIEEYTEVPYTIYGSVNHLLPEFRQRLKKYPRVEIYKFPATNLRGAREHAYYMDHLVRIAIADGVSHISTLHLDSFPIRHGWAAELADRLSESCVFATIDRINTACFYFHRDFYLKCQPTFLLSETERGSTEYGQYIEEFNPNQHSGVGYGFKAYLERLSWYYLRESSRARNTCGRIYDDMIFHMRGAVRLSRERVGRLSSILSRPGYVITIEKAITLLGSIISPAVRRVLQSYFKPLLNHLVDRPTLQYQRKQLLYEKKQLLNDPKSYLNYLRYGGP